ncbi:tRNA uridine(34) 5-carboxymethylaminomethyl modification radical SAM/GNAT enzyme Elp3 [Candidatus Woesearchaeota archaeon]|nr:tRNA uridine(34) 5-carboxymethylaminomethyl modification radical SAM/GNAT enzyme Elp3 [Candidatus Woesearchaeota archaeon]
MTYFDELIAWIKEKKPSKDEITKKKILLCKQFKQKDIPSDIEVYMQAKTEDLSAIRTLLQTKPMRTGSGVTVVATMTKPWVCPHGTCTFCPGGLKSFYGDTPKSYTGKEPSTMRGRRNDYDPYRIVFNRLQQYVLLGQNPEKVDQIIMGGTFPAMPRMYQEEFVYYSFKAYNDFSDLFFREGVFDIDAFKMFFELPGDQHDKGREERIKEKILSLKKRNKKTLEEEQERNETAAIRCIGITIETKPDWGLLKHGLEMLRLGATRVELGIQTVYNEILAVVNRGHTLEDSKRSIAELRDLGFKLNFHMMPGLPTPEGGRVDRERDIDSLRTIFENPEFRPDMLKIYPCMVMPGTALEEDYKQGRFIPLTTKKAADVIVEGMRYVPEYCRIMRMQRDIPTNATTAGVDRTNLKQYVDILAEERNVKCRCIRCREVRAQVITAAPELVIREYTASNGKEFFISAEAEDKIFGFVRLRLPPRSLHPTITLTSALIRELHVYGQAVGIGKSGEGKVQHKGLGRKLMAKAEEIAKAEGKDKMIVISGVGAREYYRKLGYEREGPYMVKTQC